MRVAQYLRLYSCLFQTAVEWGLNEEEEKEKEGDEEEEAVADDIESNKFRR